jgi:methylglyoxal synthase
LPAVTQAFCFYIGNTLKRMIMTNINRKPVPVKIVIISFNHKKKDLVEWAYKHKDLLTKQELTAAGTTGEVLEGTLNMEVHRIPSMLTGGHKQLAQMIKQHQIDMLLLFFDTKKSNRRERYIWELIHLAVNMDVIVACNRATADVLMNSFSPNGNRQLESEKQTLFMQGDNRRNHTFKIGSVLAAI